MTLHSSALGKAPIPAEQQPHHYHRSWKPLAPWEYGGEVVWDWEELVLPLRHRRPGFEARGLTRIRNRTSSSNCSSSCLNEPIDP